MSDKQFPRKPCTMLNADPPVQLEYCDFDDKAEYVSRSSTVETVTVLKNNKPVHVQKEVVRYNLVPPAGAAWQKTADEAKDNVLVYNLKTGHVWPVGRKNFAERYKEGWYSRMQTEETQGDKRIDKVKKSKEQSDPSDEVPEEKPKKAKRRGRKKTRKVKPKK